MQGYAPKLPLVLAVRPVNDGGTFATPAVFGAHRGQDQFKAYAGPFCKNLMEQDPMCSSFTDDDIEAVARMNHNHKITHVRVKEIFNRSLSNVKGALIKTFLRVLGFGCSRGSPTHFTNFFLPDPERTEAQQFLIEVLGIGGSTSTGKVPDTYATWAVAPHHSLSKWRTVSPGDVKKIRAAVHEFLSSTGGSKKPLSAAEVQEADSPASTLHVDGTDILFATGEMRYVFNTWMGRCTEPFSDAARARGSAGVTADGTGDGDEEPCPRAVLGDTSIITVARADAYISAWLATTVRARMLQKGCR